MTTTQTAAQQQENQWCYFAMTELEWDTLERVARLHGKKDFRRFFNAEMHRFAKRTDLPSVPEAPPKRKNRYEIPVELIPFFQNLARLYDISISKALFRFIIMPHLVHTDLFLGFTVMQTPVFTTTVQDGHQVTYHMKEKQP